MEISGLEDEYQLATDKPKLIYLKTPAAAREPTLQALAEEPAIAEALQDGWWRAFVYRVTLGKKTEWMN
jgi:hypothetical protein